MISTFLRLAVATVFAATLAACGGKASFTVSGSIGGSDDTNLKNDGLVLANADQTLAVAANATTFSFAKQIDYGVTYAITVKTQPRHQFCSIFNGSGTAGQTASINALVRCLQNAYSIGGTISGLTVGGLVLTNGSTGGTVGPFSAGTSVPFTFAASVFDGTVFGVTVLTQPPGLFCSVANGTAVMGEAAVTNIAVSCVPKP